jgi:hypothetical protein
LKETKETPSGELLRQFMREIGGEVLQERRGIRMADFRYQNLVIELKTLQGDRSGLINLETKKMFQKWMQQGKLVAFGQPLVRLQSVRPECQKEWIGLYAKVVKPILVDKNQQIKSTKAALNIPEAKGVLLLANEGDFSQHPVDFAKLCGMIVYEKGAKRRKFTGIDAVVVMSLHLRIKSNAVPSGQTFYWVSEILNPGDVELLHTLNELSDMWRNFLEKTTGLKLRNHNLDGNAYRAARVKGEEI